MQPSSQFFFAEQPLQSKPLSLETSDYFTTGAQKNVGIAYK